jgi:hypothetical protein
VQKLIDHLGALPPRDGPFPRMTPANPQEQLDQFPPDWRLVELVAEHAFSLPMVVERHTQVARELALCKRWVLSHPIAVRGWGSEGAVFDFAPRDEHELEWAKALLSVSHAGPSGALGASPAEASGIVRPSAQST